MGTKRMGSRKRPATGNFKTAMRFGQAVASGGKSEVIRAVKNRLKAKDGVYAKRKPMKKGRMVYKHGGKHNEKIMYAMGGEVQNPN